MANGTYKQGGSGKGSAKVKGCNLSNLEDISKAKERKTCGSCSSWQGFNVIGDTLCKKGVKYNMNKDTHQCEEWHNE